MSNGTLHIRKNTGDVVGTQPHLNLIEGAGISITVSDDPINGEVDITIAAGATAGVAVRTTEKNLGSTPRRGDSFTFTDALLTGTENLVITQGPGPYTNKGTLADECEMDSIVLCAKAAPGSATAYWNSQTFVAGNFKFTYTVQ